MIKPTIYKSVPVANIGSRRMESITLVEKTKIVSILQKLTTAIKLKHS